MCCVKHKFNTEEFIQKAKEKHGDVFDYSKVQYIKGNKKVIIICRIHGEFLQNAQSHLNLIGCSRCSKTYNYTTIEWIEKAKEKQGDRYDYTKTEYKNNNKKVIIICKEHGEFLQLPISHLNKYGCSKCSNTYNYGIEVFIKKAREKHGENYSYSNVKYFNTRKKILITCNKHGDFLQSPITHLNGAGCPFCINKTEWKLYDKIRQIYPSTITQFSPEWIGRKRYDLCILDHNIIIELDGPQHFKQVMNWCSPKEQYINDKEKEKLANKNSFCIIRLLQEDVFYDNYDWFLELKQNIQKIINDIPHINNIYMDKNDEYKKMSY